MNKLLLPLAAALALASCSPPYPKTYKSFEGKKVTVRFENGGAVSGYLYSDGAVGYRYENDLVPEKVKIINWDKVISVGPIQTR